MASVPFIIEGSTAMLSAKRKLFLSNARLRSKFWIGMMESFLFCLHLVHFFTYCDVSILDVIMTSYPCDYVLLSHKCPGFSMHDAK